MKRLILTLVFLACAHVVHAQTTTVQAIWTSPDSPALSNSYTYTLQRNTTTPVAVSAVTCSNASGPTQCTGTAVLASTTVVPGDSFVLTAKNASGGTTPSAPFVFPNAPGKPVLTITITVVGP